MLNFELLVGEIELGAEKSEIGRRCERATFVIETLEGFQMGQCECGIAFRPIDLVSDQVDVSKWRNGFGEIDTAERTVEISHGCIKRAALIFDFRSDAPDKG